MDGKMEGADWLIPWFTIWTSPRATIRKIVDTDPRRYVIGIAWLGGALAALNANVTFATMKLPPSYPRMPMVMHGPAGTAVSAFLQGLVAIAVLYAGGSLLRWAGGMLGGTAQTVEVRAAIAWGQVPEIYLIVLRVMLAVSGLHTVTFPPEFSPYGILLAVLGIWGLIVWLKCLGEVHHFSAWRALGASALALFSVVGVLIGFLLACWVAVMISHRMM